MSWLNKWWPKLGSSAGKPRLSLDPREKHIHLKLQPPSMDPISNFTPRAEQSLAMARREAELLHHSYVGTEHVLLGLLAMGPGAATNALLTRGMTLEAVRGEVGKQVGPSPSQKIVSNIPYTPQVKEVLAQAAEEAQSLRHTYIGLEHILLALLIEPDEVVSRVFKRFAVEPRFVRLAVLREIDPNSQAAPAASTTKTPPVPTSAKTAPQVNAPKAVTLPPPAPAPPPTKPPPPVNAPQPAKAPPPSAPASTTANGAVDIAKRYDIYCTDANQAVSVHRSARFKSLKQLLPGMQNDPLSAFFELELENGQSIFVPRSSVIRFETPSAGSAK